MEKEGIGDQEQSDEEGGEFFVNREAFLVFAECLRARRGTKVQEAQRNYEL